MNVTLTALDGVRVGHATDVERLTGTTAVVFDRPLPMAYVSHGGSPGTFNTDALRLGRSASCGDAIFISGGSWTGLQAGAEVMRTLIRTGIGRRSHQIVNPNVTGAIVYDLGTRIGQFDRRLGARAVEAATADPVARGNVGAGTGTSVGKFQYAQRGTVFAGMKAGVGCARVDLGGGAIVVALTVLNAIGNVMTRDGRILAGNRSGEANAPFRTFQDFSRFLTGGLETDTTISIVGTNVRLEGREQYQRVAEYAAQGHIRAISPINTSMDGDTVFVFSTEERNEVLSEAGLDIAARNRWERLGIDALGQAAATAVQDSVYDACLEAESISISWALDGVIPSAADLGTHP